MTHPETLRLVAKHLGVPARDETDDLEAVLGLGVQMLDDLLPEYSTVDVLSDPEIREGVKVFSNWPTIPQLYIKGEFVGGSDIVMEMFQNGELQKKLADVA